MRRPAVVCLLLCAVVLVSCGDGGRTPLPSDCFPGLRSSRTYDVLAYRLTGRLGAPGEWVDGLVEEIDLALCPASLGHVALDARVNVSRVQVLRGGVWQDLWFRGGQELPFPEDELHLLLPRGEGPEFTLRVQYEVRRGWLDHGEVSGDLVGSRIVSTDSEPRLTRRWMVSNDEEPRDRARLSITLDLPADQELVAPGERVVDLPLLDGYRRVGYTLDLPVPPHAMSFAAGQLERVERSYTSPVSGRTMPFALWFRRGLAFDPERVLDMMAEDVAALEALAGPYPFDRYSVFVRPSPPFVRGMEYVTLVAFSESGSTGALDRTLHLHELAHQWFGDWVTIHRYRDLWVKEGTATLLEFAAQRAERDLEGRGRRMGAAFAYDFFHPVTYDWPTPRYDTGPYFRGAALLTQIRALVGEDAFWRSVRTFLAVHALGSATSEDLVRAFSPELDEATIREVLDALPLTGMPGLNVTVEPQEGGTRLALVLQDVSGMLLVPYAATAVDAAGVARVVMAHDGRTEGLVVPEGGYLALDEEDLAPYDFDDRFPPELFLPPPRGPAMEAFLSRSAAVQERALLRGFPALEPGELRAVRRGARLLAGPDPGHPGRVPGPRAGRRVAGRARRGAPRAAGDPLRSRPRRLRRRGGRGVRARAARARGRADDRGAGAARVPAVLRLRAGRPGRHRPAARRRADAGAAGAGGRAPGGPLTLRAARRGAGARSR